MADQPGSATHLPDPEAVTNAVTDIVTRSQRLVSEFMTRQVEEGVSTDIDPLNITNAFMEATAAMMTNPARMLEMQVGFWQDYMKLWQATASRMMGQDTPPVIEPEKGDRRFKDEDWNENEVFNFIKQSYLLTSRWVRQAVDEVEGLDDKDKQKVDFYTRQFVDALSPSNFVLTNPEVLRTTTETGGENLLRGLENMLDDLERGQGRLAIRMTDLDAFTVGENIATTPGKVVYRNRMMELIQYSPTTETVCQAPLLIIPPWINKYYILDLREKNSFIKWAVDQGHTVFIVSWVNPDESYRDTGFEDYMLEGPMEALDAIEQATGEHQVNVIGYCIGGTLLSAMLAYMKAKGTADRIRSATFFTTLVDFSDAGELTVFIDEEQVSALEEKMSERGYLEGSEMATTFNMLRSNDLIWSFVVNNYLLGKEPFPFDLLYWNSDSTRLPAKMHSFYLRKMYMENKLIQPGGLTLDGVPIDVTTVDTPSYLLSTKDDHIAPWKATYTATQLYKGPTRFVLAGSGHIAGVINPPAANKYGYWINNRKPKDPDAWLNKAEQREGSWWPDWDAWVKKHAGKKDLPARTPGDGKLTVLEDAPGSYVKTRIV